MQQREVVVGGGGGEGEREQMKGEEGEGSFLALELTDCRLAVKLTSGMPV